MKLRNKASIVIGVTLIIMIVALYVTSRIILLGGFAKLEEQNTRQNVERALSALSDELSILDGTVSDWAAWDDTYAFIQDLGSDYIDSNLVDETFTALRLNVVLFIKPSGQTLFGKCFDLRKEKEVPLPQSLQEHLSPGSLLLRHPDTESSIKGIVHLTEGPMLIGSRPILTSEDEGPIRGTLLMGRYLDHTQIERLAEVTYLSLTVRPFEDSEAAPDFQAAVLSASEERPILVRPLSEESIAGYALLEDIYGKPILVLEANMPRDIYEQGQATVSYLILSLLATTLAFAVAALLFLEKEVLSPLTGLSKTVSSIGKSRDLSARVPVRGRNELSTLAGEMNKMLQSLEESGTERKRAEETLRYMAYHDPLTGLPNRALFNDRLTLELARAQRNRQKLAVMLLDLDYFKNINDTLGHSVGDRLLQVAGNRLRSLLRSSDTVARMGGDEFLLMLPEIARVQDTSRVAQKILGAFREPFVLDGHKLHTTASIGIATYPDAGEDADTLTKNADIAMYRAKKRGRNNYEHYSVEVNATHSKGMTGATRNYAHLKRHGR